MPILGGVNPANTTSKRYLLEQIDRANTIIGNTNAPIHAIGPDATPNNIISTTQAIRDIMSKVDFLCPDGFCLKVSNPDTFSFVLSAVGTYTVNWGDGKQEIISVLNILNPITATHTYDNAVGDYVVTVTGLATEYLGTHPVDKSIPVVAFSAPELITQVKGDFGKVFPIISAKTSGIPSFANLFSGCINLSGPIPQTLFASVQGQPRSEMFNSLFDSCTSLSGSIPENLFAGITGTPTYALFRYTFRNCANLTGPIPGTLFAGLVGAPARNMFRWTFQNTGVSGQIPANLFAGIKGAPVDAAFSGTFSQCKNLTGEIPGTLFRGIVGAPNGQLFHNTFAHCPGLTSIGEGLFDGISGTLTANSFTETFLNATGLRGSSVKSGGQYLYEKWPDSTIAQVNRSYRGATGLTDYASIPAPWK